jgi:predicted metal-dependent HD superfamily phosphohydrolase
MATASASSAEALAVATAIGEAAVVTSLLAPDPMTSHPIDLEFLEAWRGVGAQDDGSACLAALRAGWREPQRHYHSLQHLSECLDLLRAHRVHAQRPDELVLALWFHDAIYDPRGKDNEQRSADWSTRALSEARADPAAIARIHSLVLDTAHAAEPAPGDPSLLVDIDLAILGAVPERFAQYERQVRAEYAWVPGFLYRYKRRQLLREFAVREPLYRTPVLRARLEAQARVNLARAIG